MEWLLIGLSLPWSACFILGLLTFCPDSPILPGLISLRFLVVLVEFFEHRVFGELVWLDTSSGIRALATLLWPKLPQA